MPKQVITTCRNGTQEHWSTNRSPFFQQKCCKETLYKSANPFSAVLGTTLKEHLFTNDATVLFKRRKQSTKIEISYHKICIPLPSHINTLSDGSCARTINPRATPTTTPTNVRSRSRLLRNARVTFTQGCIVGYNLRLNSLSPLFYIRQVNCSVELSRLKTHTHTHKFLNKCNASVDNIVV